LRTSVVAPPPLAIHVDVCPAATGTTSGVIASKSQPTSTGAPHPPVNALQIGIAVRSHVVELERDGARGRVGEPHAGVVSGARRIRDRRRRWSRCSCPTVACERQGGDRRGAAQVVVRRLCACGRREQRCGQCRRRARCMANLPGGRYHPRRRGSIGKSIESTRSPTWQYGRARGPCGSHGATEQLVLPGRPRPLVREKHCFTSSRRRSRRGAPDALRSPIGRGRRSRSVRAVRRTDRPTSGRRQAMLRASSP
jgi:hypothetical protein